jgi:DNA-binding CsgD family transcriptional regulator
MLDRYGVGQQLAHFGAQTAAFASQVLGAEWSCFYQLDARGEPFGFQAHRVPWEVRESYLEHDIGRSDPLHPSCLIGQDLSFVSAFDPRLSCSLESRREYWSFLSTFGTRDAAEMIFRVGGRAVAGLSLLWVGRSDMRADRDSGEAVQSYVEFNLAAHYRPASQETGKRAGLTNRELEIVQLVCAGCTNAQIAHRLGIGLATVKTHLLHVFEKVGVATRAALVSCFLASAGPPNA